MSAAAALSSMKPKSNTGTALNRTGGVVMPDMSVKWSPGDKVQHAKWGIGTVVSISGSGEETQLQIAFPNEGIKKLMQKYAPLKKV